MPPSPWVVRVDDLTDPRVVDLIAFHVADMRAVSPPGTSYAFDLAELRAPHVTAWTAWDGDRLGGVVALAHGNDGTAELKSMRTHPDQVRRGVARALLDAVRTHARTTGTRRIVLETGTGPEFDASVALYRQAGFTDCAPFGGYAAGPANQFLELRPA